MLSVPVSNKRKLQEYNEALGVRTLQRSRSVK